MNICLESRQESVQESVQEAPQESRQESAQDSVQEAPQESCVLCTRRGVGWWWPRVGQSQGEFRYAVVTGSYAVATHNQVIRK